MSIPITPIELEMERLKIERERLEIEKTKAASDQMFFNRNLGTVITAVVSLAAVLVSVSKVWVAKISKDKEIAVSQAQKEKEFSLLAAQQEREWNLNLVKFVSEHSNVLFGGNKEQRDRITKVIIATFPTYVTDALFQKLENIPNPPESQRAWRDVREKILPRIDARLSGNISDAHTRLAISGATIIVLAPQGITRFEAVTDLNGHFSVAGLPASQSRNIYIVTAQHPGYFTQRMVVRVTAGTETKAEMPLMPLGTW